MEVQLRQGNDFHRFSVYLPIERDVHTTPRQRMMIQRLNNSLIRRNSILTWMLFGIHLQDARRIHWDFTTLVLRKALRCSVRQGMHILEVGTGPYALLPRYVLRRTACRIDACDINPDYISHARTQISNTVQGMRIFKSDLFSAVDRRYDIIFSNVLYIPRAEGKRRGIDRMHARETDWCGGARGDEFIARFLAGGKEYLSPEGTLLLGFNTSYLGCETVEQRCREHGYRIAAVTQQTGNPSRVYHLAPEERSGRFHEQVSDMTRQGTAS